MSEWLLQFKDVFYTYPGTTNPAIARLNLNIPQGKNCAVIGHNGCGKTTLFLLANGLYKPNKGNIQWQGKHLKYDHKSLIKLRQEVGLVFQNPEQQLIATTVEEDISYGLCNIGCSETIIEEKVTEILTSFELNSIANRPIYQLSLGQKKLVSLAGVMVLKPTLLLLDEPTAYLDPLHSRQLAETLTKIKDQGTTIVMATHDLEWVYNWADWLFVLREGKLILEGTPQEVFSQTELLENLKLGVPLVHKLLSLVEKIDQFTTIDQLKNNILKMLK